MEKRTGKNVLSQTDNYKTTGRNPLQEFRPVVLIVLCLLAGLECQVDARRIERGRRQCRSCNRQL